ncbi:hypothetical protein ACOSQ2_022806 [Xanthoceras sorbifolium]
MTALFFLFSSKNVDLHARLKKNSPFDVDNQGSGGSSPEGDAVGALLLGNWTIGLPDIGMNVEEPPSSVVHIETHYVPNTNPLFPTLTKNAGLASQRKKKKSRFDADNQGSDSSSTDDGDAF